MTAQQSDQWIRKIGLIVSSGTNGLDLSQLEITFYVNQSDLESPTNAVIRVRNLSESTSKQIEKEFSRVTLQAGYEKGAYGVVFDGTIKQVRRGRYNGMDTYLEIYAADGDEALNFGVVNSTLAAGSKYKDQVAKYAEAMSLPVGYQEYGIGDPQLIRGKVMYGMARAGMRTLARSTNTRWSVVDGKVVIFPMTSYIPGEAVVLNATTGMIGLPEQTQEGIEVTCLLNPKIKIGTAVQINNADIQRQPISLDYTAFNVFPSISDDGFYRVLVAEHQGDIRGNPWYTKMTCLSIDKTAAPDNSVLEFG